MCSVYLTPSGVHLVNGSPQYRGRGLDQLHLRTHVALHIGAHEEIVLPPFLGGQTSFGLDDGVDASNCTQAAQMEHRFRSRVSLGTQLKEAKRGPAFVGNLPCNFKENSVLQIELFVPLLQAGQGRDGQAAGQRHAG